MSLEKALAVEEIGETFFKPMSVACVRLCTDSFLFHAEVGFTSCAGTVYARTHREEREMYFSPPTLSLSRCSLVQQVFLHGLLFTGRIGLEKREREKLRERFLGFGYGIDYGYEFVCVHCALPMPNALLFSLGKENEHKKIWEFMALFFTSPVLTQNNFW